MNKGGTLKNEGKETKRLIGLICALVLIITGVFRILASGNELCGDQPDCKPSRGHAESAEIMEDSVVPQGAVGFLYHELGNINSTLLRSYRAYASGKLVNQLRSMQYTSTVEDEANGISMNITDYVKTGKSGNVFGASLMINVEDWSTTENKNNKASSFLRSGTQKVRLKKSYPWRVMARTRMAAILPMRHLRWARAGFASPLTGGSCHKF